jgi:hypothetical protein
LSRKPRAFRPVRRRGVLLLRSERRDGFCPEQSCFVRESDRRVRSASRRQRHLAEPRRLLFQIEFSSCLLELPSPVP